MVSFKTKKISNESTVGEILKKRRESLHMTLNGVSCAIKISKDYLFWLEEGEYCNLPGEVYIKNFIKMYGAYLGVHPEELLMLYKRERDVYCNIHHKQRRIIPNPVKFLSKFYFFSTPKIVRNTLIVATVFIFLLYLGVKVEAIIRPPELTIISPATDILTDKDYIEIRGTTMPGSRVVINGQNVFVNLDGSFTEKINLSEGINEIKISAKKDHSREQTVYKRVVVKKEG